MKRRAFLKKSGVLVLSSSIVPNIARSQGSQEDHFFVSLTIEGGVDATLGLDPKSHSWLDGTDQKDIFLEYREEDLLLSKGGIYLGPSAKSLYKHSQDLLVVNGIVMRRDAGHDVLLHYINSGFGDGGQPILSGRLAGQSKVGPFGILANTPLDLGQELVTTYDPSGLVTNNEAEPLSEASIALSLMGENPSTFFEKSMLEFTKVEKIEAEIRKKHSDQLSEGSPEGLFKVVSSLFSHGKEGQRPSYHATFEASNFADNTIGTIDSHELHERSHLSAQAEMWDIVSSMFDVFKATPFKEGSLFDYTTFMVSSEFSRTPFLNPGQGKDHNSLTNSVLLAGKSINGGRVIGGSHVIPRRKRPDNIALHIGSPIDYKSGKVAFDSKKLKLTQNQREVEDHENPSDLNVELVGSQDSDLGLIFPENVVKTVASCFDSGSKKISDDFNCETIPGVVKK